MTSDITTPDTSSHSRACGIAPHEHGAFCAPDCPTCHDAQVYGAHVATSAPEPMPTAPGWTCDKPPSVMLMSLNGFDEIAIASYFGERISTLRNDGITGGRALVFVNQRRTGMKDTDAFDYAMNLTMQETMDYFAPEPKDDDNAPASAEGNSPGAYM